MLKVFLWCYLESWGRLLNLAVGDGLQCEKHVTERLLNEMNAFFCFCLLDYLD